jgi:hypothetical protein
MRGLEERPVAVQMTSRSQALFLGCVGLQLEELIFKLKSRSTAPEPFGALGVSGRSIKLMHLLSRVVSNVSGDGDGEEQCGHAPINHNGEFFTCAVTGMACFYSVLT